MFKLSFFFQERHLQEAISAGKVIPTPEVFGLEQLGEVDRLTLLYPHNNKVPKQYIHYQCKYLSLISIK